MIIYNEFICEVIWFMIQKKETIVSIGNDHNVVLYKTAFEVGLVFFCQQYFHTSKKGYLNVILFVKESPLERKQMLHDHGPWGVRNYPHSGK